MLLIFFKNPYEISYENGLYNLIQLHFHADSEHTFDGQKQPLELHLVHANEKGELAVIGILFKEGEQNLAFQKLLDNIPVKGSKIDFTGRELEMSKLLPVDRSYFSYDGSLTTPKCLEGVKWIVMKEPIEASSEQFIQFLNLKR